MVAHCKLRVQQPWEKTRYGREKKQAHAAICAMMVIIFYSDSTNGTF